jgi:hypothetical protein
MIIGAHSIIYSTNPVADRAFLRDVLKFPHVDVGEGWLVFGLPPSEVAVHPSEKNDVHEFYLMCDDLESLIAEMRQLNIVCGEIQNQDWGLRTHLNLPGGGRLGIYEPRHARPEGVTPISKRKKSLRRITKTAARIKKAKKSTRKTKRR